MKQVTYKIKTSKKADSVPFGTPVFVSGFNEMGNGFRAAWPEGTLLEKFTNRTVPIEDIIQNFNNNYFGGLMPGTVDAQYTWIIPGPKQYDVEVAIASNFDGRSVYQYMQDYARFEPTINKISINLVKTGNVTKYDLSKELGRVYIAQSNDVFNNRKGYCQHLRMMDYWKPENGSTLGGDPIDYIDDVISGNIAQTLTSPIEIPVSLKLGATTILGFDSPFTDKGFVTMLVTLHFD